jgi:hypothetical protein
VRESSFGPASTPWQCSNDFEGDALSHEVIEDSVDCLLSYGFEIRRWDEVSCVEKTLLDEGTVRGRLAESLSDRAREKGKLRELKGCNALS